MEKQFTEIASLIGDPVRSKVLWTLMDGRAYTATELSIHAETSPQNISMHLSRLVQCDLLSVEKQGRHRYYRFSRQEVAYAMEALANLVPAKPAEKKLAADADSDIRYCRSCYDHLAGKVGVAITDGLLKQQLIVQHKNSFSLTGKGRNLFGSLNIAVEELGQQRRILLRPCLDWSERQYHLAGALGAALLDMVLAEGWMRRTKNSRAMIITAKGQKLLHTYFKIDL
jgi:DNA-binding transcriptional ArsR family regulator/predicted transcriptional regulator